MRNIVVKIGTESIMEQSKLSQEMLTKISVQLAKVVSTGIAVTVVSSGAIQAGREIVAEQMIDSSAFSKQALAGIGTAKLVEMWQAALNVYGVAVAQFPVTYANFQAATERESILCNVSQYHRSKAVIPVFNVSDIATSIEIDAMEAGISENDHLCREVANLIDADGVIFITSVGGVYDYDPRVCKSAKMYRELNAKNLPKGVIKAAGKSVCGSGGMGKKLFESVKCCQNKRIVCIANCENDSIVRFAKEESVGTLLGQRNRLYR